MLVTLYFFRQNLLGIHESSDKALKIMCATTVMAVIIIVWCLVTLVVNGAGPGRAVQPDLSQKVEHVEVQPSDGSRWQFREQLGSEASTPTASPTSSC